jgi:hypothetical protein
MLRDIELEPDMPRYVGEGYVLLLNELNFNPLDGDKRHHIGNRCLLLDVLGAVEHDT